MTTTPRADHAVAVVPVEPTEAMIRAFVNLALNGDVLSHGGWPGYARDQWSAMLAAAPKPAMAGPKEVREALISIGRMVGAFLADDVSDEFLLLVPTEVKLHLGKLESIISEYTSDRDGPALTAEGRDDAPKAERPEVTEGGAP